MLIRASAVRPTTVVRSERVSAGRAAGVEGEPGCVYATVLLSMAITMPATGVKRSRVRSDDALRM
jgi:hypothetical protein